MQVLTVCLLVSLRRKLAPLTHNPFSTNKLPEGKTDMAGSIDAHGPNRAATADLLHSSRVYQVFRRAQSESLLPESVVDSRSDSPHNSPLRSFLRADCSFPSLGLRAITEIRRSRRSVFFFN